MDGQFEYYGQMVGNLDLTPEVDVSAMVWDAGILNNTEFQLKMEFKLPSDPWSSAELARLLHPRINRRVVTSTIVPHIEDTALIGFADFYQDGWYARGIVRKLPSGNVEVMWTTAWTNMREGYQY